MTTQRRTGYTGKGNGPRNQNREHYMLVNRGEKRKPIRRQIKKSEKVAINFYPFLSSE